MTQSGGVFWEGMEAELDPPDIAITTWLGEPWKVGAPGKAAHPNSRFCSSAAQCPIIHPRWEDPEGFPVDAIVFGGRRPAGKIKVRVKVRVKVGVMDGIRRSSAGGGAPGAGGVRLGTRGDAGCRSEIGRDGRCRAHGPGGDDARTGHTGRVVMHDPMAMRPFMGYNFGDYLAHWLAMERPDRRMPKIFHVNWFRLGDDGKFLWPGFGENIRVVDWICRRVASPSADGDTVAPSPVGLLPTRGSINLNGLEDRVDWDKLFSLPKDYWLQDIAETRKFFEEQVGCDLPAEIARQLTLQEARIAAM